MAEDLPHALMLSDVAQRAKIGTFSRRYREEFPSTDCT
jgi:hypothetical protein